jgi:hypothetical protein
MTRLFGVCFTGVCALATLGIGRLAAAQDVITTYYAPTVSAPVVSTYPVATTSYYAPAPVTTYYAPTTTYYAPAPVTTYYAPTTAYYAPVATPYVAAYAPVATPYVAGYAPAYYYGRPRVYVPGEPVRNFFRAL